MLQILFHAWERHLASISTDRVVRPFDWGLEWLPQNGHQPQAAPADLIGEWVAGVMTDTDRFFTPPSTDEYHLSRSPGVARSSRSRRAHDQMLTFASALETPHRENNTVYCRYFPARAARPTRAAVLVLPQWNADPGGHVLRLLHDPPTLGL